MQLNGNDFKVKQTKDWINVINQSKYSWQSELYEEEKKQMFIYINNLITTLSILKDRLNNSKLLELQEKTNELRDHMKFAREIIEQLKNLIKIEKSCLSSGMNLFKDKKKIAELSARINWMEKSLDTAIVRYNDIGNVLNLPKINLYSNIEKQTEHFKFNFISKKKKQEMEENQLKFKETQLILTDWKSPMELLKGRIVDHGITPTYRFIKKNIFGQQFIYTYSCTLFGMYVEGNDASKSKAKENAAAEMLHLIVKKQKTRSLSSHIKPFNEKELKSIPLIKYKTNYVEKLLNLCVENNYPLPMYTILSRTEHRNNLEVYYSIQCNAMDFVAIGHSNKQSTARQMSAKNIINLWEEMNLTSILRNRSKFD